MCRKSEAKSVQVRKPSKIDAQIDPKWRSTCFNSLPCQAFMSALSLAKYPYCRFHVQKKRSKIAPTQVHKPSINRRQNRSQMEGLGNHFGSLGASFWNRFGNLDGFCPRRVLGGVCGDSSAVLQAKITQLRPKMASSWSQNGLKIDARIELFFVAYL